MTVFVNAADLFGLGLLALFIVGFGLLFGLAWALEGYAKLKRWLKGERHE